MAKYNLPNGFNITGEDPDNPGSGHLIDSRFIVTSSADLYGFEDERVAEGLTAYVSESQEYFILTSKSLYTSGSAASLAAWSKIDINISGSGLGLQGTLEGGNSASLGMTASFLNVGNEVAIEKHSTQEYLVISGSGAVLENQASPTPVLGAIMFSGSFLYMGFPG